MTDFKPLDQFVVEVLPAEMSRKPLNEALSSAAKLSEGYVSYALSGLTGSIPEAMKYAVSGGKALRAFLVLESARLHGISAQKAAAAAAIECLHA